MSSVPSGWIAAAIAITPGFEVTGDPYLAVAGDFDGMGLSCGALQWNIGMGTLQPLVLALGREAVLGAMPGFGAAFWQACQGPIRTALAVVRQWQSSSRLRAAPRAELVALLGTPVMRAEQDRRIARLAEAAHGEASRWAVRSGGERARPDKRQFCWFFDLRTQNGGLRDLTPARVAQFIARNTPERADDVICDYLAGRTGPGGHDRDARRNATLWRDALGPGQLELLCMSYLRAQSSVPAWQHVVLNRKGTIAAGRGWVNSTLHDLSRFGL